MADATFTVNGAAVAGAVAVTAGSTVNLALVDTTDARLIEWTWVGNHHSSATNPTITTSGDPLGSTATFPMPAGPNQSYLLQCKLNGGVDVNGRRDASATYRAVIGVHNNNSVVPFCLGEENARNRTHGTTELLNFLLNLQGGGPDAESSQLEVTANASRTVGAYYDYDPGLAVGEQVVVGVYVHIAQDSVRENTGAASGTVTLTQQTGGLQFCGSANLSWDKSGLYYLSGATQHDVDFEISSGSLRTNLYAIGANDAIARVRLYRESTLLSWET